MILVSFCRILKGLQHCGPLLIVLITHIIIQMLRQGTTLSVKRCIIFNKFDKKRSIKEKG